MTMSHYFEVRLNRRGSDVEGSEYICPTTGVKAINISRDQGAEIRIEIPPDARLRAICDKIEAAEPQYDTRAVSCDEVASGIFTLGEYEIVKTFKAGDRSNQALRKKYFLIRKRKHNIYEEMYRAQWKAEEERNQLKQDAANVAGLRGQIESLTNQALQDASTISHLKERLEQLGQAVTLPARVTT